MKYFVKSTIQYEDGHPAMEFHLISFSQESHREMFHFSDTLSPRLYSREELDEIYPKFASYRDDFQTERLNEREEIPVDEIAEVFESWIPKNFRRR